MVSYSGFTYDTDTVGHVFRTENGGAAWMDMSGNPKLNAAIPNVPVNNILQDTGLCGTYYAATDIGVFYSADYAQRWQPLNDGLPRVVVMSLAVHQGARILRAGTYGRSVWDLSVPNIGVPSGITFLPTTVDFGGVMIGQTSAAQQIVLTNTCSAALNIKQILLVPVDASGLRAFPFTTTCGQKLAAGQSCKINVAFAPGRVGSYQADLIVYDNGLGSPRVVSLTGIGSK